tara:strand:+ start:270 stop:527 length:258 start_codon:yes stop_codon:yes gene_type:complete
MNANRMFQIPYRGYDRFTGRGGRRCSIIGSIITQKCIYLMADCTHHGRLAFRYSANDSLLIEGPQILEASTAPTNDDDIDIFHPV